MQMDFSAHCKTQSQGKSPRPLLLFRPLQLPQLLLALTCPIPARYLVRIRPAKSETKQAIDTSAGRARELDVHVIIQASKKEGWRQTVSLCK